MPARSRGFSFLGFREFLCYFPHLEYLARVCAPMAARPSFRLFYLFISFSFNVIVSFEINKILLSDFTLQR